MKERILQFRIMGSKAIHVYKGLTQVDYLKDEAQLKDFEAIESNWKELFRWIMSIGKYVDFYDKNGDEDGNFAELWFNHIYTVLIDIVQSKLEDSESEYIQNVGLPYTAQNVSNLESNIKGWIERIDGYIRMRMMKGDDVEKCSAMQVAKNIKKELEQSLSNSCGTVPVGAAPIIHSEMWKTVNAIKKKGDSYLQLVEKAGNMDTGLSLLLVFIRNYSRVISGFNQRFSLLPEFYHNRVLMVSQQKAIQDRAHLLITPLDIVKGYLLPAKTKFVAGKKEDDTELIYETEKEEYVSGMAVANAFTVFQDAGNGYYKKNLNIHNGTPIRIFERDENCSDYTCGWMIESRIFLIKEGDVVINIDFELTKESIEKIGVNKIEKDAFIVYASDSKGWGVIENECVYPKTESETKRKTSNAADNNAKKVLNISIKKRIKDSLVPASIALHKIASDFPVLRILIKNKKENYDFARLIEFGKVSISLQVQHSHNIKLYNELGEIDVSKPFYPFGVQAECSSWFRFGNEELTRKKVDSFDFSGTWNNIPKTDKGYEDIYRYWYYKDNKSVEPVVKIKTDSFIIGCEVLINGIWKQVELDTTLLFGENSVKVPEKVSIKPKTKINILLYNTDNDSNKYYPFRITLKEPSIGFGVAEYRNVFAESMIFNSNVDHKVKRNFPTAPIVPMLADIELSYNSSEELDLCKPRTEDNNGIRLSRIADFDEYQFNSIEESKVELFVSKDITTHTLYLGVSNALCKKHVNLYFDLSFEKQDLSGNDSETNIKYNLEWYYQESNSWKTLSSKYVLIDETCGFTKSGYVNLELPDLATKNSLDSRNLLWLKVYIENREKESIAIRNIYMDYISVVAVNGVGLPIPSLSISKLKEENYNIDKIIQPLPGFDGKEMESKKRSSVRQSSRIFNRFRALTPRDYEQLILERFPEIEKVCCIPVDEIRVDGPPVNQVNIVVFSRSDDAIYPCTPTWKLDRVKEYISNFISPYVSVNVINPLYEFVKIGCIATVKLEVTADGATVRRIVGKINDYFAEWIQKDTFPDLSKSYSCKTLHSILANDEDIVHVFEVSVGEESIGDTDIEAGDQYICGNTPWSVLIPYPINLRLLLYSGGIENAMIEYNFVIN